MAFAGVSVIADGNRLGTPTSHPPNASSDAASGYHLLVVQDHSSTRNRATGVAMVSHFFTVGGRRWSILCYPGGNSLENAAFVSLELFLAESTDEPVKAQVEFSFVDETDKQEPARLQGSKIFEFGSYVAHGRDRFVETEALEKSKHFQNGGFLIRCDVVVLNPTCRTSPFVAVPPSDMHQNITDLLLAGVGTDVVFRVGGETFAAHRCILAARSAFFKALLFGPMKEGTSTMIQIDDMEATVFKALLGFIYSDTLPALAEGEEEEQKQGIILLQHLLVTADRYGLERLRAMCEKKLCEHISVSTAPTILALAAQHDCYGLKAACYEFLHCPANMKAVLVTDGFDHLCRSYPPVMKDLIARMLQAPK